MEEDVFVLPLSFAQQRLWFLEQLVDGSPAYNLDLAMTLDGEFDAAALERALQEVVRRHEVLRTTFAEIEGEPVQVISPWRAVPLRRIDLTNLPTGEAEVTAQQLAGANGREPFDLARGPLLRATLLQLGPRRHVLLLALHHIVTDGWSMDVLLHELTTLYSGYAAGEEVDLPELPLQYGDFAVWQREWLTGSRLSSTLAYWREQLGGLPRLELPTDRPRPAMKSGRGSSLAFDVAVPLATKLRELAKHEGVTLFMAMLAGFATLLRRYTGQTDVAVGSPIANRTRSELEGLIGFFVNTLVLRVSLAGAPSFRTVLARAKAVALGAYAHQDLPFERLVEELQPERDLSRNPLFDVAFQCDTVSGGSLPLPGVQVSSLNRPHETAKFDLSLGLWDYAEGIAGQFEYSTDLFDPPSIERMVGHFMTMLEGAVADPDCEIETLPLLTPAERQQILVEWNATTSPLSPEPIQALVKRQAERTPHAIAVTHGATSLTYATLERRASQLAHVIRSRGVGVDAVVAVWLDRSVDLIVALLGVLKAGGAYLPIDPAVPRGRLLAVLADARADLVLTTTARAARLPSGFYPTTQHTRGGAPGAPSYLCLDDAGMELEAAPVVQAAAVDPHQLAYLIYTSGSSGAPKGVEISHRSLANLVSWHVRTYSVNAGDRGSQLAALDFDAAVWEIWPYLSAGASVHLVDEAIRASPHLLLDWFASQQITVAFVPTPILEGMLAGPFPPGLALRALLTGGDVLHAAPAHQLPFDLFNHYGPTENTVVSTSARVVPGHIGPPPIGRPIANTEAYVLDTAGQPVPVGVPGELHVGGLSLGRGYRHRPDLTAARFRVHSLASRASRLYATGDRARLRSDGQIEFLGRTDDQIKLHGFRIEPAEIETALRLHPAIAEARVLRREDTPGVPRLVAYLLASGQERALNDDISAFLRDHVPAYMLPASYVWLGQLPLTSHGKLDREALPPPEAVRPSLSTPFATPRTGLERTIAAVWREVLQVPDVGRDDNFFDLGGRSLLLVRVHALLTAQFGGAISVLDLFRYPTIAALAAHLHQNGSASAPRSTPDAGPAYAVSLAGSRLPAEGLDD